MRTHAAARATPHAVHQPRSIGLPARLPVIAAPSDTGGEWPVDHAAAHHYAELTLRGLDFTKPMIVLYVSGTANPTKGEIPQINANFTNAFYRVWRDGKASLGLMRYESSWNVRPSMATGVETLRYVLRGIAARGGGHRVLIAGESQGAWVISEALKDPVVKRIITRAAIWGHPSVAATHFHDGTDPKVREVNHRWDHVSMPITGNRRQAIDAQIALETKLEPGNLPLIGSALLDNPVAGVLSLVSVVRGMLPRPLRGFIPEPHNYEEDFVAGATWLRRGSGR